MADGGTLTFTDPDGYAAAIGDARLNLTITGAGDFKAQLTWLHLQHLKIYRCCESLSRIGYISLSSKMTFLSFPINATSAIFSGSSVQNGDIIFYRPGERVHQRFNGGCQWGLIALSAQHFADCSKALLGRSFVSPGGVLLRPKTLTSARNASRLSTSGTCTGPTIVLLRGGIYGLHWLSDVSVAVRQRERTIASGNPNRLLAVGALVLAAACCSCAGSTLQGALIPTSESAEGASRVTILVATTRQRSTDDAGEMFNGKRASAMSYARISVSIPPDDARKIGEIQWPASPPGNPRREFVTASAEYLDRPDFSAAIAATARATHRDKAMIFVHGFNSRFDEAAYRLAQIVQDSKAPVVPVLFSWPSQGVVGLRAYEADRDSAGQSRDSLEQLLDALALSSNVKEVILLCHSMGCLLTLDALRSRSLRTGTIGAKVRNVLLVAPDVDFNTFREQMRQMGNARPRFALFLSQDDRALKLSKLLWGGATRLGDINPDEEPYRSELEHEKVIAFDVTHLEGNSHSRAFDDVTSVMGMIERRLAAGQQLAEDTSRTSVASQ